MKTPPCSGHEFESEDYKTETKVQKAKDNTMEIQDHKIKGIEYIPSPNTSGKFKKGQPDTIIIHYTAGRDAASSIKTLITPYSKASAHLVIGRDGKITQLVPFDTISWHAGKSSYEGREGYNSYSIGIEIDNAGVLTEVEGGYKSWFGKIYPKEQVLKATHRNETKPRFWHTYTEEQIKATEEICKTLIKTYNIKHILGHEEISVGRKSDPGPAFPLDELRNSLLPKI